MVRRKTPNEGRLDNVIDNLLDRMQDVDDNEEFATMVDQLGKLYKMRDTETPKRISPDTLVLVGGNLLGIILILGYERAHIVTSRAINFVMKLR